MTVRLNKGNLPDHARSINKSEIEARAEHARINAEFAERARWWKSPEGLAYRKTLDEFYAEEDARELERMARDLIVECAL